MSIVEREPQVEQKPAELDEAGKILLKAANLVREHGLWQENDFDSCTPESQCLILSLDAVSEGGFWSKDLFEAERRVLCSMGFQSLGDAYRWNDTPGRTAEEVAEALERAAYFG